MHQTSHIWISMAILLGGLLSGSVGLAQGFGTGQSPWMQLNNQVSLSVEHYSVRGIDNRQLPLTYVFHGSPTLQLGETPVPFSFVVSSFSNSYQTPFNQMGTSPKYKWIQVHAGYRNMQFSNFTLGGQRMLGAGVELTPGKWQFGFFWGVLRKAITPDSTIVATPPPGSLFFGPGYRRTGWGAKIGFGKNEKSNVTLSMFRGTDHVKSLDTQFHSLVPKPEMNMVLGLAWRVVLSKKIAWVSDAAVSAYTRNMNSDSLSLEGIPSAEFIGRTFMPRVSSQYLSALETGIHYTGKKFKASLKYRRIDPDFKSMGIYFINSDLEEYTLNPSWRITQKLSLSGSVGLQRDNLKEIKQRSTERVIYRISGDWSASKWFALGAQYSNFGITQNALAPNIADTTLVRQVNSMYGLQPRFTIMREEVAQMIMINASRQELSNAFSGTFAPPDVNTTQVTAVYSYNMIKRAISLSPSLTYVDVSSSLFETQSIGSALSVNLPLKFIPVNATVQGAHFLNKTNGQSSGSTSSGSLQFNYRLKNGMTFQLGSQYMKNKGSVTEALPEFSELRLRAGFAWSFTKSVKKKEKP